MNHFTNEEEKDVFLYAIQKKQDLNRVNGKSIQLWL